VTEPFEVKVPGEDDREGAVIRKQSGAWNVEAWWPLGARGGPRELRITPAEDADPVRVAQGISMGTLTTLPLVKMTEEYAEASPAMDEIARQLGAYEDTIESEHRARGRSDFFYLLIAAEYAALVAAGERTPVQVMAARIGRSTDSVRNWLRQARKLGFLTRDQGRRVSGELTDAAKELLGQMEPVKPYAPGADEQADARPPIVAAIVTSPLGVLVGRRNDGKPPWTFIAGEQDAVQDENPADTAVREVKEETGLRVEAGGVIGQRVHPKTGRTMIYIAATPTHGTNVFVGDEDELAEVRWVSLAEADELMGGMIFEPVHEHLARALDGGDG
jgi:8-oxo-dGTP pyrophosphatase MutT (NUDIX family)